MLVVVFLIAPVGAPRNIIAINRTSDSITISWDDVERNLLNGELRRYEISWKEVASYGSGRIIPELAGRKRRKKRDIDQQDIDPQGNIFKITDLKVYTNYSVQIAAYTVKRGPYSNETYLMSGEGGR